MADNNFVAFAASHLVNYFRQKHGITMEQARRIIDRVGNNREKLNAEAKKLKKR